ncbi:MAG TPA: hypothetical protein VM580_16170 [Labilithrix sp.]|nr:hypothetical protein [Labilithrix sp.]
MVANVLGSHADLPRAGTDCEGEGEPRSGPIPVRRAEYAYEATSDRVLTNVPARAHFASTELAFVYDHYEFHDLVSSGLRAELRFHFGALAQVPRAQPRHSSEVNVVGALPLTRSTVLMARGFVGVATMGNAVFLATVATFARRWLDRAQAPHRDDATTV